jgi:hypothetical protein
MYGHPIVGLYGHKSHPKAKRGRGRPSNLSKFLEKQSDMFEAERYLAILEQRYPALKIAGRLTTEAAQVGAPASAGSNTPQPNRGDKSTNGAPGTKIND